MGVSPLCRTPLVVCRLRSSGLCRERYLAGYAGRYSYPPRSSHDACAQIYVYRGAIQHHGIVTHVPWARQADGVSVAAGVLPQSPSTSTTSSSPAAGVQVVHFDSACDGVESTSLESFLVVSARRESRVKGRFCERIDTFGFSAAQRRAPTMVDFPARLLRYIPWGVLSGATP